MSGQQQVETVPHGSAAQNTQADAALVERRDAKEVCGVATPDGAGHQKGQGNKTIGTRTEQHIRYLLDKWRARRREQRRAEKRQAREHQHDHPQIQRVQRPTATKGKQRQPDYEHERKDVEGHLHRHAGN